MCNIIHAWLDSRPEMWFTDCTHLLYVCDDISHLQSKLIIMFFIIVKQNHCFCEGIWKRRGEKEGRDKRGEGKGGEREGGRRREGEERSWIVTI